MVANISMVAEQRIAGVWKAVYWPAAAGRRKESSDNWRVWESGTFAFEDAVDHPLGCNAFVILANFQPERASGQLTSIAGMRGLPADCAAETSLQLRGDDAASGWVTLRELVEFDWSRITVSRRGELRSCDDDDVSDGLFSIVLPALLRLGTPDNVRLVFRFSY